MGGGSGGVEGFLQLQLCQDCPEQTDSRTKTEDRKRGRQTDKTDERKREREREQRSRNLRKRGYVKCWKDGGWKLKIVVNRHTETKRKQKEIEKKWFYQCLYDLFLASTPKYTITSQNVWELR